MCSTTCAACALHHRGTPLTAAKVLARLSAWTRGMGHFVPSRVGTALSMTRAIESNVARYRKLMALVDRLFVLNDFSRELAILHGARPTQVGVCRLGVSLAGLTPKPGPKEVPTSLPLRIGFAARIHPVKGADVLMDAVAGLGPDAPVEVDLRGPASPGVGEAHLKQLQAKADADPRVTISEPVPGREIPRLLRSFDVLCCPSTWFENGPTVALEARAVGTPVIASRLGNPMELIRNGIDGALFPPADAAALGDLIAQLLQDPGRVDAWRAAIPPTRTMEEIAGEMSAAYTRLRRGEA